MKKSIVSLFKWLKHTFWYSAFTRALLQTKNKQNGSIVLFDRTFEYHYGLAFYETYTELFERKIYKFSTQHTTPLIIDCGANMGLSVLYFSTLYPNSKILAFEPDVTVLPYLKKNVVHQKIQDVTIYEKGVWTEATTLSFYTDEGLGGRIGTEYLNQEPVKIETVRLKDFLTTPIAFLKIDIEGAEYEVLKDCETSLHFVEHLFVEYHSFYDDEQHLESILSLLKRQGFRYHLKESFSRRKPFVDRRLVCEKYDMAINVFAYRN